eukprot:2588231-Prorocentrum_lima.AAC.1
MTSSLVGSEMCIRDSPKKGRHARCIQPVVGSVDSFFTRRLKGSFSSTPVSYTHLTLPTICSV